MGRVLFQEWGKEINNKFYSEGRKIALLINNFPVHPQIENLKSIKPFIFPQNTTSQTQPMGQGVIRSMTAQYRKNIPRKIVWSLEKKKNLPKNFSATRNANVSCILESSNNENRCELFSKV